MLKIPISIFSLSFSFLKKNEAKGCHEEAVVVAWATCKNKLKKLTRCLVATNADKAKLKILWECVTLECIELRAESELTSHRHLVFTMIKVKRLPDQRIKLDFLNINKSPDTAEKKVPVSRATHSAREKISVR